VKTCANFGRRPFCTVQLFVRRVRAFRSSPRRRTKRPPDACPLAAAATAGLRYVRDEQPGIERRRRGDGFVYVGADGKTIRNATVLDRIRALAVPPAWTNVWICPDPRGHIQATGRDAKGRKQYRYHAAWRAHRDETKFDRLQTFAGVLPLIRRRTNTDLEQSGLPRNKVLATIVQLLEKSLIRVGNEEYARHNQSFGLTTLRSRHVRVNGGTLRFQFRGKSGVHHSVSVNDRRLARVVKQCRDLPGQELFQYLDEAGEAQVVDSGDINGYLKGDHRSGLHREGLSHVVGHGSGCDRASRSAAARHEARNRAQRERGDRSGCWFAGEHAHRLPEVVRASGSCRCLSRRSDGIGVEPQEGADANRGIARRRNCASRLY
jgi:DNA topoisomerase IB